MSQYNPGKSKNKYFVAKESAKLSVMSLKAGSRQFSPVIVLSLPAIFQ
jgi:hypothetical protein